MDALLGETADEMRHEFAASESKDYTSYDKTQKFGLNEHAYGWDLSDNALDEAIDKVRSNLIAFRADALHTELE